MIGGINTSLSALQVAAKRIEVSANNLANQQSTRSIVNGESANTPYQPQRVVQTTASGAPIATVETVDNPTQKVYLPDHTDADEYGLVSMPNVDAASELVEMKIASYDYKANLKAIQVQNDTEQSLLDILS